GGNIADHDRVTVGGRFHHFVERQHAEGSRLVEHDEALTGNFLECIAHDASDNIGRSTWGIRHDHLDRAVRIFVLRDGHPRETEDGKQDHGQTFHRFLSLLTRRGSGARSCYAFIPCKLCEASLTVKNTTSPSGVALPACTVFAGM